MVLKLHNQNTVNKDPTIVISRCIARASRKRGPLTTKHGKPTVNEEHTKNIKIKTLSTSSDTDSVVSTFTNFLTMQKQPVEHPERNHSKLRPLRPRVPLVLQPVTLVNPSPIPLLVKLEPVNTVLLQAENSTQHSLKSKKKENAFKCSLCPITLRRKSDLTRHNRYTHKLNAFSDDSLVHRCHHCGYRCKRKYDIKRHIICMHLPNTSPDLANLTCAICGRNFQNKTNLRNHVMKLHFKKDSNSDTICNKPVKITRGKFFCCDICDEGFHSQAKLLAHRNVVHAAAEPMYWDHFRNSRHYAKLCALCKRYYKEGKYLVHTCETQHENAVQQMQKLLESEPAYKCDMCSLCFRWKLLYQQHRENLHPLAAVIDWESLPQTKISNYCNSCFVALEGDEISSNHKCADYQKEKRIKCNACSICDASYTRKSDYYRHLRTKHPAEVCDQETKLIRKKTSTISCPYCEETSTNRISILDHIKLIHNIDTDTPFVCVACNKIFKRKATLDTHNQIYHPEEQSKEEINRILKEAEILLNGERAFHCSSCNRNMFDSTRFIAHYRLHNIERKYTCDLCGKQTRTQHQLNSHIKFIHLNIRNFECDICGKSFHAKQSCEEHRRIHTGERPYSCEICGKTFIAMNALFTHQKFHNDFYAHSCHLCPKKFKVRRSLTNHIRTHTGERPFQCDLCPKTFNNSSRFSYHKKVTHSDNRPFTCSQCGSCFKANKFLMRHMKLHTIRTHIQFRRRNNPAYFASQGTSNEGKNSSKKKCAEVSTEDGDHKKYAMDVTCKAEELIESGYLEETYANEENEIEFNLENFCIIEEYEGDALLDAFIKQGDEVECDLNEVTLCTSNSFFHCQVCDFTSAITDEFNNHLCLPSRVEEIALCICNICDKAFSSESRLAVHVNKMHDIETNSDDRQLIQLSNGKFQCSICKKEFCRKLNASQHFLTHVSEKNIKCNLCEFKCHTKTQLVVHKAKHVKRFCCEICSKMFTYKFQLDTHVQGVHYNMRPFACSICDKTFKTRYNFGSHMAQHKDVRNFQCPYCSKRCRKSYDLRIHIRTHTKEKPFQCSYCQKCYSQNTDRRKHEKRCGTKQNLAQIFEERYHDNDITDAMPLKLSDDTVMDSFSLLNY